MGKQNPALPFGLEKQTPAPQFPPPPEGPLIAPRQRVQTAALSLSLPRARPEHRVCTVCPSPPGATLL